MTGLASYIRMAMEALRIPDGVFPKLEIREDNRFARVLGVPRLPRYADSITIGGYTFPLNSPLDRFYEHVIIFYDDLPIRSHQETPREVLTNVGAREVVYVEPDAGYEHLVPDEPFLSVDATENGIIGFNHGLKLGDGSEPAVVLVQKRVLPEFYREGDFFRVPENTYALRK